MPVQYLTDPQLDALLTGQLHEPLALLRGDLRVGGPIDRVLEANDRVNRVWTFFWPTVAFLNQLGLLVVWACGAWRVFDFRIQPEELLAFVLYIMRFYTRLESMSRMFSMTQRAAASSTATLGATAARDRAACTQLIRVR